MVQCEMCGTETASPNRIKVEGAELDVCDSCTEFGTEVETADSSASTSTKYSTSTSSSSETKTNSTTSSGGTRQQDMFDDIEELAQDYDSRIRQARERAGLSQEDLAKDLNEKASLIRKLEHGEMLPTDEIQGKLERSLDIDLTAGGSSEETEWESDSSTGGYTLGDVVERKDS